MEMTLRLPAVLHGQVDKLAEIQGRDAHALAVEAMEEYVRAHTDELVAGIAREAAARYSETLDRLGRS